MDTTEVATMLGTTPRVFRAFLRSPMSTFVAVGSGARYEFSDRDVPTLEKRFSEWQGAGKPRPDSGTVKESSPKVPKADRDRAKDEQLWAEEGLVELEDIRDPRIRARVKRAARAAEDKLELLLMARGLHITQLGNKAKAS